MNVFEMTVFFKIGWEVHSVLFIKFFVVANLMSYSALVK